MSPARSFRAFVALVVVGLLVGALPASAAKVMSWNALNYPGASGASREDDFRTVIAAIDPDILVFQEINQLAGAQQMKTNVLDVIAPNEWIQATFTNGNDSDNALYYRAGDWVEIEIGEVNTTPRETDWWRLRRADHPEDPGIVIYSTHLKASTGTTNIEIRRLAARAIRDDLIFRWGGGTQPVLLMGDFNMYTSAESGYGALTGNPGELQQLFDPIDRPGPWSNNASFADVHTQSTRTVSLGDGGATGGMDDRFDQILVDADLEDGEAWDYLPETYLAFGQDGNRFNSSVNSGTNPVGQAVADALFAASDHLPVVLELQRPARVQVAPLSFDLGTALAGTELSDALQVRNQAVAPVDELDYTVVATEPGTVVSGTASGELVAGQIAEVTFDVDTTTPRVFSAGVQVQSDDPGSPAVDVPFIGAIVGPSQPSLSASEVLTSATVEELGREEALVEMVYTVSNVGAGPLQADLFVSATDITGPDAGLFLPQDPGSFTVGDTPVERRVLAVLGGQDPSGLIEATVTLTTQDDVVVAGAQPRAPLVVQLRASKAGPTSAPNATIARTTLHAPVPSPFNPRTEIRFDLARTGPVAIEVMDVRGRRVRTLVNDTLEAGEHARVFDGTDDAGRNLASGVYLVRMVAGDVREVRRAVLVR